MRHIADRFPVMLDANVLYPLVIRDVLLTFAEAGFYRPLWSDEIMMEWSSHLKAKYPGKEDRIDRTIALMREAFPEAAVSAYSDLIPSLLLPDENDRHVLAAAIAGGAAVIVTENDKDFPKDVLAKYGLERRTPDEFLLEIFQLYPSDALAVLKRTRLGYTRPPMTAAEFVKTLLSKGLASLAAELKQHEALL